jgi:RimJ/RimL family protein N-acetyltransferase/catechol 2,3-dioxygenase-like lactoylglutathione lyase family enzyme
VTLPSLTTERLWLEPLAAEHADDLHIARGDPECMRFWHTGVSPSLDATREEVARMATWNTHWAFGRAGDRAALGFVGFHGLGPDEGCGFGYCLRRSMWGGGLTVEASRAALGHGFATVRIAHAELWIDGRNQQSLRVSHKLGAILRGWAPLGRRGGTELSVITGITRAEWEGRLEPPAILNVVPVVRVSDVPRALQLWTAGLGFRVGWVVGEPPERGQVLAQWTGGPAVRLVPGEGATIVSIQVGCDLDALVERAVAAGWSLADPAADRPWGTRDATLTDPDGNAVSLAAALAAG